MTTSTTTDKPILTRGTTSYFKNLMDALFGIQHVILETQTVTVQKTLKDPRGLVKREIEILKKRTRGYYKLDDSLESVAYRQGQLDLIRFIETKLVASPQGTLDNYELIQ